MLVGECPLGIGVVLPSPRMSESDRTSVPAAAADPRAVAGPSGRHGGGRGRGRNNRRGRGRGTPRTEGVPEGVPGEQRPSNTTNTNSPSRRRRGGRSGSHGRGRSGRGAKSPAQASAESSGEGCVVHEPEVLPHQPGPSVSVPPVSTKPKAPSTARHRPRRGPPSRDGVPVASDAVPSNTPRETNSTQPPALVEPTQHLPTLLLPSPPRTKHRTASKGVPVILSRHSHPPSAIVNDPHDNAVAAAAHGNANAHETQTTNGDGTNGVHSVPPLPPTNSKTSTQKKKKKKKQPEHEPEPEAPEEPPAPVATTTDVLKSLPAQQVSITAATQVKMRRDDSSDTFDKAEATSSKIVPNRVSKNRKTKGLSQDAKVNQKAARRFNQEVRDCVDQSDPARLRELLHNRQNHHFALDPHVLETVIKAYVMAAMFEDALYCLRNCTVPGTLSSLQTERILVCLPQNLRNSSAYHAADMINALCIATLFDTPTRRTYFLRIVRGIALEFLEEATSARDRICSAPCERLVRSGVCVVDATLQRGKKPTELVVVPGEQLGVFVPDTLENRGIQAGDAVSILPYAGPYPMSAESLDRNMVEATVINTNPTVLRLQDKTNASLYATLTEKIPNNVYRVDKLANRMGFNRQLSAAVAMASPLEDAATRDLKRACPELIKAITAMDENIMRAQQGRLPKGQMTSTAELCGQAIPWSVEDEHEDLDPDTIRAASRLALEKYGALEGLNASQRLAVEGASTNRLTLVQGPPGTGKTAVAIRILQHWARMALAATEKGENPTPILATSDSNIAVDNLVEGCAAVGLRVVRLGRPEAIRPELLRFCIDRPPSTYGNSSSNGNSNNAYSATNHKDRIKQLKTAQVICCTCIGSGGDILDAMTFDRVLLDEATQATEPAVLVPLMRGCRQLVLVGDHCQLPPTVLSTRAEEEGHGVPLFSRMVACGVPPYMLDTQYRMHPCIAMFPSDLFYGGLLRNGVSAPERRPLAGFPWPREEFPVAFLPIQGVEMDDGVSKYNDAEAAAACNAVSLLLQGGQCSASDIAVVTPYAAQARLIRRMIRRILPDSGPPFIEVASVDGFQGREKEAVVFSAVRSNDYGSIGFTSDWRRVNVSFTRARRALIVIGNEHTLRRGDPDTWMPWLAWADAHGINMDKPGMPRGRYDPEQLRRVRGGTTAAEMLKDVLERQQAQLKDAERRLERAEKNAAGHIVGNGEEAAEDEDMADSTPALTLEEDLAQLANADGNWDDSEDEDQKPLRHSPSKATLASATSSADFRSDDDVNAAVDVWDL